MQVLIIALLLLFPFPTPAAPHTWVLGDPITPGHTWAATTASIAGAGSVAIIALQGLPVADEPLPLVQDGDIVLWSIGGPDKLAGTPVDGFYAAVAYWVLNTEARGAHVVLLGPAGEYMAAVQHLTDSIILPVQATDEQITTAATTPNITTQWIERQTVLRITWQGVGWHCLWIDQHPLTCGVNSGSLDLTMGGIDAAYAPLAGRALRLINVEGQVVVQAVVPARVYTLALPVIRGA